MSAFISPSHAVTAVDSTANGTINDVIGNKTDTHDGDSVMAGIHVLNEHAHKASKVVPSGAPGIQVAAGDAASWTLGSFVQIVAENGITSAFDIHFINLEVVSATGTYEVVLYAVETEISRFRFTVVGTPNNLKYTPIPIQTDIIPANTKIQAKVMSSSGAADTITISLFYHIY